MKKEKMIAFSFSLFLGIITWFTLATSVRKGLPLLDASIFEYFGYAMSHGQRMYLDLFDHKGPVIFLINYLGYSIGASLGIKILYIASLIVFFYIGYYISRLFTGIRNSFVVLIITFIILESFFEGGWGLEGYILPCLAYSLYIFIKYFLTDKVKGYEIVLTGFSFAVVLFTKANMIGMWLVFSLLISIKLIYQREVISLLKHIGLFIIGSIVFILPCSVLAGMYEAIQFADIVITIDADGQDDINCMDKMIEEYKSGSEIVYGVRDNRDTDSAFKRVTAEGFYKVLRLFGAEVVFNHADYRLVSKRFLKELEKFTEVNLFLRGLMPLVGFKYSYVSYKRHERIAGESHYPLSKMLGLAMDGITSLSIKPIRLITSLGVLTSLFSFLLIVWVIWSKFAGTVVAGWASTYAIVSLLGGVQLISLGVIGEYVGKIYLETKRRPRYIISDRTFDVDSVSSDFNH